MIKKLQIQLLCFIMLIKLWLEAMEQNLFACSLYRPETAAKFQQEWHNLIVMVNLQRGLGNAILCSFFYRILKGEGNMLKNHQLLLFCWLLQYFFFFVTSCHFTLLLVKDHGHGFRSRTTFISKHAEQKKKTMKKTCILKRCQTLTC